MGWWVVCYDVPANQPRRRRALSTALEGHGRRVLYSVFELHADDGQIGHLLARAAPLVAGGGALLAQPWCARCRQYRFGAPIEGWDPSVVLR